jgi:hypothetical protein
MNHRFNRRDHSTARSSKQEVPLSERRYQELLGQASALFASEERDPAAEKARVVAEIQAQMGEWGISVEDLEG